MMEHGKAINTTPNTFEKNPHQVENIVAILNTVNEKILRAGKGNRRYFISM